MDEPGLGPDDVIYNDLQDDVPHDDETLPSEGPSVKAKARLNKAKAKRKLSSVWDHFDWVIDEKQNRNVSIAIPF